MGAAAPNEERLESWKDIAAYLGKSVRTVIRWEANEGLPVRRHQHEKKPSVFAYRSEIDAWWAGRRAELAHEHGPAPRKWTLRHGPVLGLAAAVCVTGIFGYYLAKLPARAPALFKPEVLTSYPGYQSLPALSPDGSWLAFTWNNPAGASNMDVYLQSVGSAEPKRLTTHPDFDFGPSWSADGKWLAFLRRTKDMQTSIWIMPSLGGVERKVADLELTLLLDATQLSWSPDGKWLLVPNREEDNEGLFLVSTEGGGQRRLTASSLERGHMDPQFSPDGQSVAFRCENMERSSEICILRLDAGLRPIGKPEAITKLGFRSTSPVWSSDGRWVVFSGGEFLSDSALYRVQVFPLDRRRVPEKLIAEGPEQYGLAMSRRGGTLAFTRRQDDANLWVVERERGVWKPARQLSAFSSNRMERSPELSPDGKSLAFTSNRHGRMELWIGQRDGSHLRRPPSLSGGSVWWVRWSPDGAKLAVSTGESGGFLYVIKEQGGQPLRLAPDAIDPCWSADGEWIFYLRKASENTGIFKIRAKGGMEVRLIGPPGGRISPGRDGEFLYYEQADGIWRLSLRDPQSRQLVIPGSYRGLAAGPDGIFTISKDLKLEFHSFRGGPPVMVAKVLDPYTSFTVSQDGNSVIYSGIDSRQTNLMLLRGL